MKGLQFIIVTFMIFLLSSCSREIDRSELEVFALRHVEGTNEWIVDDFSLFTGDDILEYDWETHTIIFVDEFLENRVIGETDDDEVMRGSKTLSLYYPDQFAIYLRGEELYRGYVEPQMFISFFPGGPMIVEVESGIRIDCFNNSLDTRGDEKLRNYLKETHLLK